jgi:hypothetical protein
MPQFCFAEGGLWKGACFLEDDGWCWRAWGPLAKEGCRGRSVVEVDSEKVPLEGPLSKDLPLSVRDGAATGVTHNCALPLLHQQWHREEVLVQAGHVQDVGYVEDLPIVVQLYCSGTESFSLHAFGGATDGASCGVRQV